MLSSMSATAPDVKQIINLQSVTMAIIFSLSTAVANQLIGRVPSTLSIGLLLVFILLVIWLFASIAARWDDGVGTWRWWKRFVHTIISLIFLLMIYISTQTIMSFFTDTTSTGAVTLLQLFSAQIWVVIIGLTFIQVVQSIDNGPKRYVSELVEKTSFNNTSTELRNEIERLKSEMSDLKGKSPSKTSSSALSSYRNVNDNNKEA